MHEWNLYTEAEMSPKYLSSTTGDHYSVNYRTLKNALAILH